MNFGQKSLKTTLKASWGTKGLVALEHFVPTNQTQLAENNDGRRRQPQKRLLRKVDAASVNLTKGRPFNIRSENLQFADEKSLVLLCNKVRKFKRPFKCRYKLKICLFHVEIITFLDDCHNHAVVF
jgi:hypothetical protein